MDGRPDTGGLARRRGRIQRDDRVGWMDHTQRARISECSILRRARVSRVDPLELAFRWSPVSTLAMAGVNTPLASSVRLFGSPVLVVLMALACVILADLAKRRRTSLTAVAILVSLPLAGLVPWVATTEGDTIRVAVVQGGGPQNTRADLCQNRQVFERHMEASQLISEPVDLVLWPEDVVHPAADTASSGRCPDPSLSRSEATERIRQLAKNLDTVLITGWFEPSADGNSNLNYSLVTDSTGVIGDRYDKVQLVPFGEFVPLRGLIERFSSELPSRDVQAGTAPAVLDSELGPLGVAISWEVFFDHRARDAIGNGGAVLLNPTNGSSYWLTIVQSQQIASSQLRALETDRWVLQAAPTGFSAIIDPSGAVVARTGVSEQQVLIETIISAKAAPSGGVRGMAGPHRLTGDRDRRPPRFGQPSHRQSLPSPQTSPPEKTLTDPTNGGGGHAG